MTSAPDFSRGIVLLAHGSRDPLWSAPIEAVAALIQSRQPATAVCCAYLEMRSPTLPEAMATLIAQGAHPIRVFPLFLGVGKHAREDLPELMAAVQALHPGMVIELLPTAGEQARLTELLADIALE